MIKFENTEVMGFEGAIRGMRNPMNSWDKSDSFHCYNRPACVGCAYDIDGSCTAKHPDVYVIGPNDLDLARRLAKGGPVHAKYRRQIFVSVDITAPLYWWKEFDTYKVGTTANSCSTMHKIHAKEFTRDDFSCEKLHNVRNHNLWANWGNNPDGSYRFGNLDLLDLTIMVLNDCRERYLVSKNKNEWEQMIQLLPSSYNQKRTVTMDYENLCGAYHSRKDHKLDEWRVGFCEWAKSLPYSELFTMEWEEEKV